MSVPGVDEILALVEKDPTLVASSELKNIDSRRSAKPVNPAVVAILGDDLSGEDWAVRARASLRDLAYKIDGVSRVRPCLALKKLLKDGLVTNQVFDFNRKKFIRESRQTLFPSERIVKAPLGPRAKRKFNLWPLSALIRAVLTGIYGLAVQGEAVPESFPEETGVKKLDQQLCQLKDMALQRMNVVSRLLATLRQRVAAKEAGCAGSSAGSAASAASAASASPDKASKIG